MRNAICVLPAQTTAEIGRLSVSLLTCFLWPLIEAQNILVVTQPSWTSTLIVVVRSTQHTTALAVCHLYIHHARQHRFNMHCPSIPPSSPKHFHQLTNKPHQPRNGSKRRWRGLDEPRSRCSMSSTKRIKISRQ